ncbi:MAG: DUF7336 domain-containing protein [Psychrobium sp.]
MNNVFILQHLHVVDSHTEDVKIIGVYHSREKANEAINQLITASGFVDHPQLITSDEDIGKSGFYIDEYPLDKTHWSEGFVSL